MNIVLVTGCLGLVGSQSCDLFSKHFDLVVGIDNNFRENFFGKDGSTDWLKKKLEKNIKNFVYYNFDIRSSKIEKIYSKYNSDIKLIVHCAAQPSHDYATLRPLEDFDINARATLTLLENFRKYCPESLFIYMSTNKVYGDSPNKLNLIEQKYRYTIDPRSIFKNGINESMSLDRSIHSLFGCSKLYGDLITQEYKYYFGCKTVVLRAGCITGGNHSGAKLHGFLSYLVKCALKNETYEIIGYNGKQVRDNLHSSDLCQLLIEIYNKPPDKIIFNIGGGDKLSISILEAIKIIESKLSKKIRVTYIPENRIGDHMWYITDLTKIKKKYPQWEMQHNLDSIIDDIIINQKKLIN